MLTAGQAHESTQLHNLMHAVHRPRRIGWPEKLAGDKGYSYDSTRQFLASCGIEPVIPYKSNQQPPNPDYSLMPAGFGSGGRTPVLTT